MPQVQSLNDETYKAVSLRAQVSRTIKNIVRTHEGEKPEVILAAVKAYTASKPSVLDVRIINGDLRVCCEGTTYFISLKSPKRVQAPTL